MNDIKLIVFKLVVMSMTETENVLDLKIHITSREKFKIPKEQTKQ